MAIIAALASAYGQALEIFQAGIQARRRIGRHDVAHPANEILFHWSKRDGIMRDYWAASIGLKLFHRVVEADARTPNEGQGQERRSQTHESRTAAAAVHQEMGAALVHRRRHPDILYSRCLSVIPRSSTAFDDRRLHGTRLLPVDLPAEAEALTPN
jgi:hypothetical protein